MLLCFLDIEIITAEADAVKVNNVWRALMT